MVSFEPDRKPARFELGSVVITPGAKAALNEDDVIKSIRRHEEGDWGDVCEEDKWSNERALQKECRVVSVYHDAGGTKFYIITEWDRSATTILLPEEY
jgi:hypothetical protein